MKKVFWGAIVLLFLFFGMAFADTANEAFEKGKEAFLNGDYITAANWYRKAAEQGLADAQFNLGFMYYKGKGVPQNFAEAAKWYRKAAEQGYADAQVSLGLMYHDGEGVPQNFAEAAKWYRKAAEQGYADAQVLLGVMYYKGEGVPQDYMQSYIWLSIAAANLSGGLRERAVNMRDNVAKGLSPKQLEEAQKIASEWKPKKGTP